MNRSSGSNALKVVRIIDGSKFGPFYNPQVKIYDRPVKQRFRCDSCGERVCTIEIEDTEEINGLVLENCAYCGFLSPEVNYKKVVE